MIDQDNLPEGHSLVESLGDEPQVLTPENELVPLEELTPQHGSWMDSDPEKLVEALERREVNRGRLMAWVKQSLVEGVDFGTVKNRPSLWKAGAEKIAGMLGFRAEWIGLDEMLAEVKAGKKIIALRCVLTNMSGEVESEGVGARNIDDERGDVNKALKMAKKSALIDAVLTAAGLSEVFTQDRSPDHDDDDGDGNWPTIDENQVADLYALATELFGKKAESVLKSLARRRFQFDDGDWEKIPEHRLNDAISSLEQKATEQSMENEDDAG